MLGYVSRIRSDSRVERNKEIVQVSGEKYENKRSVSDNKDMHSSQQMGGNPAEQRAEWNAATKWI